MGCRCAHFYVRYAKPYSSFSFDWTRQGNQKSKPDRVLILGSTKRLGRRGFGSTKRLGRRGFDQIWCHLLLWDMFGHSRAPCGRHRVETVLTIRVTCSHAAKDVGQAHACPSRGYYAYYMAEATCLVVERTRHPLVL